MIKIIEFTPATPSLNTNPKWEKMGHILIEVGQLRVWMDVIKGKNGNPWFRIPNVKIGDVWKETYAFLKEPEFNKYVTKEIEKEFKERFMI